MQRDHYVLHEAALGSVPRSIDDPIRTHESNISGFLNLLVASRDARVKRFIFAVQFYMATIPALPKVESVIGRPLSPYAVTKYVNELYADVFARCSGQEIDRVEVFQCFRPAAGSERRIRGRDFPMDNGTYQE